MKNSVIAYVGWLLVACAFGFYIYGISKGILISLAAKPGMPIEKFHEVISTTLGSLQAILLANLGVILGISLARPQSAIAARIMFKPSAATNNQKTTPLPLDVRDKIQLVAMIVFILSLISCLITWIIKDFEPTSEKIASIIPESGKMFIGVVLAYVTSVLSYNPPGNSENSGQQNN